MLETNPQPAKANFEAVLLDRRRDLPQAMMVQLAVMLMTFEEKLTFDEMLVSINGGSSRGGETRVAPPAIRTNLNRMSCVSHSPHWEEKKTYGREEHSEELCQSCFFSKNGRQGCLISLPSLRKAFLPNFDETHLS